MQVKWVDNNNAGRGFEYLYLSDADYCAYVERCGSDNLPFVATRVDSAAPSGNNGGSHGSGAVYPHWRVTDIIGEEDGLGVECLSGSGAIAAAFSRAYDEAFTVTLVSGRTVGIGAYLARLGHRYRPLQLVQTCACVYQVS